MNRRSSDYLQQHHQLLKVLDEEKDLDDLSDSFLTLTIWDYGKGVNNIIQLVHILTEEINYGHGLQLTQDCMMGETSTEENLNRDMSQQCGLMERDARGASKSSAPTTPIQI